MARAVEEAAVVLVCFTERYKNSPYCRTEAEYAYNTHRRIVALRLEAGYTPDGWLGPLCLNNIFYDFSAPENFNDEWAKLRDELSIVIASNTDSINAADGNGDSQKSAAEAVTKPTTTPVIVSRHPMLDVSNWKTTDVQKWLEENKLQHLQDWFEEVDGPLLEEFVDMRHEAPEAFHQTLLKDKMGLRVTDILKIKRAIKQLYIRNSSFSNSGVKATKHGEMTTH